MQTNKEYLNKALSNKHFVKFLRKHKCLTKYKYNVLHFTKKRGTLEWDYNFHNSINNAFHWSNTIQGNDYWYHLYNLWKNSIKHVCKLKRK